MINSFPYFSKLEIKHKNIIEAFATRFEPYHDFSFINLYCWNSDGSTEISMLNGNLIVRLPDYVNGTPVLTLLGDTSIDESIDQLLGTAKELRLVPQLVVDNIFNKDKFTLAEDRDNFDYIYKLTDLSNLSGYKFKKKRNKTNVVKSAFSEKIEVKSSNYIDSDTAVQLNNVFTEWSMNSKQPSDELRFERHAFTTLLENSSHFNLLLTTVSLESELVAFSINEIVNPDWAICHFEKALPVHSQIGTFIAWQATKDLLDIGCSYVNWEPDLGIPGLRKSKMSFQPDFFLKKYEIKKRITV